MKLCGKPMPKAKTGADRGLCSHSLHHVGGHGNGTCPHCGVILTADNTPPSRRNSKSRGPCRECNTKQMTKRRGGSPKNYQHPGEKHSFPCGCAGVLPKTGQTNQFAARTPGKNRTDGMCRVSQILSASKSSARRLGYIAIPRDTPHSVIRKMMAEPNCERCGEPLKWEFGVGKTPHLHHNHETGDPLGFTHPVCNPRAMENEIDRLRAEIKRLK